MRAVLVCLNLIALLLLFEVTFNVEPLHRDRDCVKSHGRFSLYLEQDVSDGATFKYGYSSICDAWKPMAPMQITYPAAGGGGPWSP